MVNLVYKVGGEKRCRHIKTAEELIAACNTPENIRNWNNFRRTGEDRYKHALVQVNYNCQVPDGGLLKGIKTMSPFFFYDIDCRDREECRRIIEQLLQMKEELGLVEVAESASFGVHAVGRRMSGHTILECQVRISILTKTEMDTNNKENNRVVFHGPIDAETTPLLEDALFTESLSDEEATAEYLLLKERESQGLEDVPAGAKRANKHYRPWEEYNAGVAALADADTVGARQSSSKLDSALAVAALADADTVGARQSSSKLDSALAVAALQCCSSKTTASVQSDVAYDSEARYNGFLFKDIIGKYWELFNDGKCPTDGDRNVLTFELAVTLRSICGYDVEKLREVVPNYWAKADGSCSREDYAEYSKTIENALKEPRKGMPYRLKQVLQALKGQAGVKACGGTLTSPPPMPKKLPPLIKLLTKNVPWFYKPAVANAVFPALGVHLHGVKFRYWDNVEHEATFMNVLIGRQSIGKGTIKKPVEYIMEDIRQRDIPNRQREAEWKQRNPGAKQKKDPRPTDICIQMLIDNLTDAVFNQRIVDANNNGERFIYTIVDEIEGLKKVTSKGTVDEVGLLIRKAFDNSLAGQERVGADSVSGIAPLRWNFNACTTPPNARKFFYKMVNDGTVSRLDVSTIIKADDDDDTAPILGIYDHTFAEELKPYLKRLDAASGLIECQQAKKLALEIKQQNKDIAKLYDSEAYRVFSYRANVIAWLKGMVLYVAHGCKWSKEIAEFVRWTQQYNLWCKMLYFGQQLEKELREEVEIQRQSGPQNLLELLPDEFTKEQYRQMRLQQGKTGDGDGTLRSWHSRGYIMYDEASGRYVKTEEYKRKYG